MRGVQAQVLPKRPPQNAHAHAHGRETVRVHVAWLRQAFHALRRARSTQGDARAQHAQESRNGGRGGGGGRRRRSTRRRPGNDADGHGGRNAYKLSTAVARARVTKRQNSYFFIS